MRKSVLIQLALWGGLAIVAAALLFTGLSGAGQFDATEWNSLSPGEGEVYFDQSFSVEDVTRLELKLEAEEAVFYETDGNTVRVVQTGKRLKSGEVVSVSEREGTLSIQRRYSEGGFLRFFDTRQASCLEIYLPKGFVPSLEGEVSASRLTFKDPVAFGNVELELEAGKLEAKDTLTAGHVTILVQAGDAKLGSLLSESFRLETEAGSITADSLSGYGTLSAEAGKVDIKCLVLTGDLDLSAEAGNVTVVLEGSPSVELTGKQSAGNVEAYFPLYKDSGRISGSSGSAPFFKIRAEAEAGKVEIKHTA